MYGAALAMPQIARSAGWPGTLLALVCRIYFFTALNYLLQGFLLSMIGEEQLTWYAFAGRMHLCDYGAWMEDCPDGSNCKGPLGTQYSAPRLYDYDIWSTRIFIRDSLKAIFPHKANEVHDKVDPGEYGMENYYCRFVCVFVFMLEVVDDLSGTYVLARTLYQLPNSADSWIRYEVPSWGTKDDVKEMKDCRELDFVKYSVGGMPLHWKLFNVMFLVIPKFGLWLALSKSGVQYLMETAGIMNVVVNAMALTFVLKVDEMVFHKFSTCLTKEIMWRVEKMPNFSVEAEEAETETQALDRFYRTELGHNRWRSLYLMVPRRVFNVLVLLVIFLWDYYRTNCVRQEDGSWVSKDMHLPARLDYNPFRLMFGLAGTLEENPYWTIPN